MSPISLYISRSACARAEPVVSACVLEKSLEIHSKYSGRCITAADAMYVLVEDRGVKRWGSIGGVLCAGMEMRVSEEMYRN